MKNSIKSLEIKNKGELIVIDRWRNSQLKHFIETLPRPVKSNKNVRPSEKLCIDKIGKKGISRIYRVLIELKGAETLPFIKKWELELDSKLKEPEIGILLKRVHATLVNYKMSELNYKCMARWYITPDRAYKYQSETSQYCWRGCKEIGTMAHIW